MLSTYCNSVSVNLWHYLPTVKDILVSLTNPNSVWSVTLSTVAITEHNTSFKLILKTLNSVIHLDSIDVHQGYADGRILVKQNGIWLDLSLNGRIVSDIKNATEWEVPRTFVTIPPPMQATKNYTLNVGKGLSAVYATSTLGNTITISAVPELEDLIYVKPGTVIESINGVVPQDGNINIRGLGDFEVEVSAR